MTSTAITQPACVYCGAWHSGTCPKVKSIEYHENGTVKRVEFHNPIVRDPQGWPLPQIKGVTERG